MSNKVLFQIDVNDKGSPALHRLTKTFKGATKEIGSMGNVLKKVFVSGVMLQTLYKISAGLGDINRQLLKYEKTLKQIKGITDATTQTMIMYDSVIKSISNSTEHSSLNIARASLELAKMGLSTKESMSILPKVADLATGSIIDIKDAMETTGTVMFGFGKSAEYVSHIIDSMQLSVNKAPMNMEDLANSLKFVAPVAKTMGVSLLETESILNSLAKAGIKGTLAGTTLKNMFLNILKPSKDVKKVLEENNYQFKDFTDLLHKLKEAGVPVSEVLKTFNKRAIVGVEHLMANTEAVHKFTNALEDANGVAKKASETIRKSLIDQLSNLRNTFVNTLIVMKDAMSSGSVEFGINKVSESLVRLQDYVKRNPEEFQAFGDSLKKISLAMIKLAEISFENLIKNWSTFVSLAKAYIGINLALKLNKVVFSISELVKVSKVWDKMLVRNATLGNQVALATISQANAVKGLGFMMKTAIPYATAAIIAYEGISIALDKYTKNMRLATKASTDMTRSSIINRITALENLKRAIKYHDKVIKQGLSSDYAPFRKDALKKQKNYDKWLQARKESIAKTYKIDSRTLETVKNLKGINLLLKGEKINLDKIKKVKEDEKRLTQNGLSIEKAVTDNIGKRVRLKHAEYLREKKIYDLKSNLTIRGIETPEVPKVPDYGRYKIGTHSGGFVGQLKLYNTHIQEFYHDYIQRIDNYKKRATLAIAIVTKEIEKNQTKYQKTLKSREVVVQRLNSYYLREKELKETINSLSSEDKATEDGKKLITTYGILERQIEDTEKTLNNLDKALANSSSNLSKAESNQKALLEEKDKFLKKANKDLFNQNVKSHNENVAALKEYAYRQIDIYSQINSKIIEMAVSVNEYQLKLMQQRHEAEMASLDKKEKFALMVAGNSSYKKEIIERDYQLKIARLKKKQLVEERRLKNQRKAMSITESLVNTAVGVTGSLRIGGAAGIALAIATAAAGAVQTALIAAQKYRRGGLITGKGGGTSDSVPIMASNNEYMIPASTTLALGGAQGVESMIADKLDAFGSVSRNVNMFIDTFIGQKQYERDMYKRMQKEAQRW